MTVSTKSALAKFLQDEVAKWAVRMFLAALAVSLIWILTPISEKAKGIWNSPEVLSRVVRDIEALTAAVNQATGENRVIRQPPGQSYVTEPVVVGQGVTLNLVVQRTTLGATCRLIQGQSLFTDVSGVAVAGSDLRAVRQIGTDQTRLRVDLVPPPILHPGRIELYLALEYACGGRTVFDRTDTVTYTLLPKPA